MRIFYVMVTVISMYGVLQASAGATLFQAQQISKPLNKPHSSSTGEKVAIKTQPDFHEILRRYKNHQFPSPNQAFMWYAIQGKAENVRICLSRGADINFVDQTVGDSALITASRLGYEAVVHLILIQNQFIDIHHKNKWGYTALAAATAGSSCNPFVVKYLLEHGSQPSEAVGHQGIVQEFTPKIPRK